MGLMQEHFVVSKSAKSKKRESSAVKRPEKMRILLRLVHDLDGQGKVTVTEMDERICSIIDAVTMLNIIKKDVLLGSD